MSLAHSEKPPDFEAAVKNKNTLQEVREAITNTPQLKENWKDLMSNPILHVSRRFQAMKLNHQPFQCGTPVTDEELKDFSKYVLFLKPSLEHSQGLTKLVLEKSKPLTDFIDNNDHVSPYASHIKKCTKQDCFYCAGNPIQILIDEFPFCHYHH